MKETLPIHLMPPNSPPTYTMTTSSVLATFNPRKAARHRNSFLALFSLIATSIFLLSQVYPLSFTVTPLNLREPHSASLQWATANRQRKSSSILSSTPQLELDNEQELAAITSFLASLPQNVIPPFVDPTVPIDPQLVLDFDTRSPQAAQEVDAMVDDVWLRNPVVLYSKHYSPVSRQIKGVLSSMKLHPAPTIFDVDQRDDAQVLVPLLTRLTHTLDVPILLIGGKPVLPSSDIPSSSLDAPESDSSSLETDEEVPSAPRSSLEHIRELYASGELARLAVDAGAAVGARPRGKKAKNVKIAGR